MGELLVTVIVLAVFGYYVAWPWLLSLFGIHPAAPKARTPRPAPPAPRTMRVRGADAVQAGAHRARTVPEPPIGERTLSDLLPLMQRIAGHKLRMPDDLKVATGLALGIRKSGTSAAWQDFSRAWELLYPGPASPQLAADDPAAREPGEYEGSLRRRDVVSR